MPFRGIAVVVNLDSTLLKCPCCATPISLNDLRQSPAIEPIGMVLEDRIPERNMYYFNHVRPGCNTTFTVPVQALEPLVPEAIPVAILALTGACENHCVHIEDLALCSSPCHWAPYRRLLMSMRTARQRSTPES